MKNDGEEGKYEKQKEKHRKTLSISNELSKELRDIFRLHRHPLHSKSMCTLKPQLSPTIATALFFRISPPGIVLGSRRTMAIRT